jgi:hypothetical protein
MSGGLTPVYAPERCPNNLPFGKWTIEELSHPKEIVKQIIANIIGTFKNNSYLKKFENFMQME